MWWLFVGSFILLNFSKITGSTNPDMEDTLSEYSFTEYFMEGDPFYLPGLAVADLHATQFLNALAGLWHADRMIDGLALMCEELSPKLNRKGLKGIVRGICNPIQNSDAEKSCRFVWETSPIGYYDNSYNLFDRSICRPQISLVFEQFPLIRDALFNFTSYECYWGGNGRGTGKINSMILALLEWLGPFALTLTSVARYEPLTTCSLARYVITMETTNFLEHLIEVFKYPIADILEYEGTADICESDTFGTELLTNILVELSDLNKDEFCDYASEMHSRDEHLEKAVTILQNAMFIFQEERRCTNVLSLLAPLDINHVHVMYIGFNLSIPSERNVFCQQAINAFSNTSSHATSQYRLPSDFDIKWQPFRTIPGEFLPGLSFIDLIGIEGAAYRAGTIIEGLAVYCNVFEELLVQSIHDERLDPASICELIKRGNTKALEDECVSLLLGEWLDESYRFGGIHYDLFGYVFYTVRELTGVEDINEDEICRAADSLLHSDISFKNVVEAYIDAHMREAIPIADRFCHNWEEAVCFWKPYCSLSDQPASNSYHFSSPSRETVAARQGKFEEKFNGVLDMMLVLIGFDDMDTLCSAVSKDVDPSSGRATGTLTERLRSELIRSFTIVHRCSLFLDTILGLFVTDEFYHPVLDRDILYQLTGFRSSSAFCEFLSDLLLQSGLTTLQPETSEAKDVTDTSLDAFIQIALYLRRGKAGETHL